MSKHTECQRCNGVLTAELLKQCAPEVLAHQLAHALADKEELTQALENLMAHRYSAEEAYRATGRKHTADGARRAFAAARATLSKAGAK